MMAAGLPLLSFECFSTEGEHPLAVRMPLLSFECFSTEGEHLLAVRMLSGCQQAVKRRIFLPKHIFSGRQTKILTLTPKFQKITTDESFRVAVRRLSGCCQEAVGWLSGKNHHNFEAKIKFGLDGGLDITVEHISNTQCADTHEI